MSDSEEGGVGIPLLEPLSPSPSTSPPPNHKRKRETNDEPSISTTQPKKSKQKKKNKNKKPKYSEDPNLNNAQHLNLAIARMDPPLLADLLARRAARFLPPELTALEREELYVPTSAIVDTTSATNPTTGGEGFGDRDSGRELGNLPAFLESISSSYERKEREEGKEGKKEENGAPHTLVITSSGLRAADVARTLRKTPSPSSLNKKKKKPGKGKSGSGVKIAKLFAKHIKLADAIQTCRTTRMDIGVGTPQRVLDLLDPSSSSGGEGREGEEGKGGGTAAALSVRSLRRVVLDASYLDAKMRGVLDMRETCLPLLGVLRRVGLGGYNTTVVEKVEDGGRREVGLYFF